VPIFAAILATKVGIRCLRIDQSLCNVIVAIDLIFARREELDFGSGLIVFERPSPA
jgi:hypothetical protein